MTQANAGKGSAQRPGNGYGEGFDRIWNQEQQDQCGDCGGTRSKDGKPCPTCAPTEDGPVDGGGK